MEQGFTQQSLHENVEITSAGRRCWLEELHLSPLSQGWFCALPTPSTGADSLYPHRVRRHRCAINDRLLRPIIPQQQREGSPRRGVVEADEIYLGRPRAGKRGRGIRAEASVGETLLPLANRVASLLRHWLLGTHQGTICPTHREYYLDAITFRFNRRPNRSRRRPAVLPVGGPGGGGFALNK